MALQQISQQFRATRDKLWGLAAEALSDISNQFTTAYKDMGWFQVGQKQSGIRQDVLATPLLRIIGPSNDAPIGEIRALDGRLVILLDASSAQGILNIESKNPATGESMQVTPNTVNITDIDGQLLFSISASQDGSGNDVISVGGNVNAGAIGSFTLDANPFFARLVNIFNDAVNGDATATLQADADAKVELTKGADNAIRATVTATSVTLVVANASKDTTVKPESVVTPRLGVGGSAPGTDGYASVSTFLGAGMSAPAAAETLGVTGDTNLIGALDVSGAITNPLLTNEFLIALPGGTISSQDAASTRTALSVYSKTEVDAAIAAAIAGIVVDNALVGTPEEHSHTLS